MKLYEVAPTKQGRPKVENITNMGIGLQGSSSTDIRYSIVTKVEDYTTSNKVVVLVDATAGDVDITLPAVSASNGLFYTIKKIDGTDSIVKVIGTIDGESNVELRSKNQYLTIVCNGSAWYIIGGEYVGLENVLSEKLDEVVDVLNKMVLLTKGNNINLAILVDEDPIDIEE